MARLLPPDSSLTYTSFEARKPDPSVFGAFTAYCNTSVQPPARGECGGVDATLA